MVKGVGSYFMADVGGFLNEVFFGVDFFDGFTGAVDDLPFAGLTKFLKVVFEKGIGGVEGGHDGPQGRVCVLNKLLYFETHGTEGFLISVHGQWVLKRRGWACVVSY